MNKGGLRIHPRNLKKKLDCKCCNQSYSGALFVIKGGLRVNPRKFSKNLIANVVVTVIPEVYL